MPTSTEVEIGQAGEKIVVEWLKGKGYTIDVWDTQAPGSTDIEAHGTSAHLLVQVKSSVHPNEPASLSSDEERNIKSRATRIGAIAWEARVKLDSNLNLMGDIMWRELKS
jgi:Holliday junction resolvase-like predicted endonuclease